MKETERNPPGDSPLEVLSFDPQLAEPVSSLDGNNDDEAQIDPRCFAPVSTRKNDLSNSVKTSILYVLFEYCMKEGLLRFQFIDQCTNIYRLEFFANASFHSHFRDSVDQWRIKINEDEVLRNRLIRQHHDKLVRLTYPLPKKSGSSPKRKRGYNDKGSTRPLHQRFRSDKETTVSVWAEDLRLTQKVVVYGRRPTVTYRRLPYSEEVGRLLELGLLKIEGNFIVATPSSED